MSRRFFILMGIAFVGGISGFTLARSGFTSGPSRVSDDRVNIQGNGSLLSRGNKRTHSQLLRDLGADNTAVNEATGSSELAALWESFETDARGTIARQRLLNRWAAIDPEGASAYFEKHQTWREHTDFVRAWVLIDPDAACAHVLGDQAMASRLVTGLVAHHPEECFALMQKWEDLSGASHYVFTRATRVIFDRFFVENPEKAFSRLRTLTGDRRTAALVGIASAQARSNPTAARAWAESLTDPDERTKALAAVMEKKGKTDPDAILSWLKENRYNVGWGQPGHLAFREKIRRDPAAALEWVSRHFPESTNHYSFADTFWREFRKMGEKKALLDIVDLPDPELRDRLFERLKGMPFTNIAETLAVVDQSASAETRTSLRASLIGGLAVKDLPAAVAYLESIGDEANTDLWQAAFKDRASVGFDGHSDLFWRTIKNLPPEEAEPYLSSQIHNLAREAAPEALEKLETYREHPAYPEMAKAVARAKASHDPEEAKAWIGTLDESLRGTVAKSFAAQLPSASVPETYRWLQTLNLQEEDIANAVGWMLPSWSSRNGMAASEFVLNLDPGPTRQAAIAGLLDSNYRRDPQTALKWVEEIGDPEQQARWRATTEAFVNKTKRLSNQ